MTRRSLWRITKYIAITGVLFAMYLFGYKVGSWGANDRIYRDWPNLPDCQLTDAARLPNKDHTYLAIVVKRSCGGGENIDYFLRVNRGSGSWWTIVELENDQYPMSDPVAAWITNTKVQVTVSTKTLSGTLVENQGADLEIVRVYEPREPGVFPNYRQF